MNYYFYSNFSKNIKKWNLNVGVGLNTNGNIYYNLANGELNKTVSSSYGGSLNLRQYIQKKYDFNINFGPSYNYGESSLQPDRNNNGWGMNGQYSFNIYLPWKFQISSEGDYTYTAATHASNAAFERFIVDATVSKKFLTDETLRFGVGVNGVLNQNPGCSRSATSTHITQNRYTASARCLTLSLTSDFNKMGGGVP